MSIIDEKGEERELTLEEQLEVAHSEIRQLKEALRKEIQFKTAKDFPSHAQKLDIWVPAIDALNLFVKINEARRWAIDHNDPWRKLIFQIDEYGKVKSADLEDIA